MGQENTNTDSGIEKINELFQKDLSYNLEGYRELYHNSIEHRDEFWRFQARRLKWDKEFIKIVEEDFSDAGISWFSDGKLNASRNALDAHIENGREDEKALVFFTDDLQILSYSYKELYEQVTLLAAALESEGFKVGERITLYLPDCPETVIFMLACSRLGIVYVPVPTRFTAEITAEIISDSGSSMLVVSLDAKQKSYREKARKVVEKSKNIKIITIGEENSKSLVSYSDFVNRIEIKPQKSCPSVDSEHPIFIIYANSAAGIPRGSVFATGGFLVQAAASFDYIFQPDGDNRSGESILCTLNLASVTGQSYGLWGPLIEGSTIVISAEGEETNCECLRRVINECKSPALLTTPGMLASLKHELNENPLSDKGNFSLVACSGDTLTPRFVSFAGRALTTGAERVINLWIQSESGAALINTYSDSELNHPGALGLPFFGIEALTLSNLGEKCRINESGQLVFSASWPAMIRTIWGQANRFYELYFRRIPGYFSTNDGVRIDCEGFFWFMGRLDDVIKVRGQSLATSEIEAVLVAHPDISEAAVVSVGIEDIDNLYAFLVLESGKPENEEESVPSAFESGLNDYIAERIGEFAVPKRFIFTKELPRTHSGKVVRRILRRVVTGDISLDEDMSHVVNPESIEGLIRQ